LNKFAATSWGKKLAKQASKAAMTDFDRFKAAVAKAKKARAVRKVFSQVSTPCSQFHIKAARAAPASIAVRMV
jgi:hypothetical protein